MRISLDEAAGWVAQYEASGMEHRKFADAHGLHYSCISRYRRRIERAECEPATTAMFHELPHPLSATASMSACVVLPNGYRVEIPSGSLDENHTSVAALVQKLARHQNLRGA